MSAMYEPREQAVPLTADLVRHHALLGLREPRIAMPVTRPARPAISFCPARCVPRRPTCQSRALAAGHTSASSVANRRRIATGRTTSSHHTCLRTCVSYCDKPNCVPSRCSPICGLSCCVCRITAHALGYLDTVADHRPEPLGAVMFYRQLGSAACGNSTHGGRSGCMCRTGAAPAPLPRSCFPSYAPSMLCRARASLSTAVGLIVSHLLRFDGPGLFHSQGSLDRSYIAPSAMTKNTHAILW